MENTCAYCSIDVDLREYLISDCSGNGIYINGSNKLSADDDLDMSDVKIDFCPMCGKKF